MNRPAIRWASLAAVVLLAATLRLHALGDVPAGLFCDEAAIGYNAFALGTYGIDENGERLPLFIWSFGGYKNPIYIYAASIPIHLLGLNAFTTRLPAALFGIGTVVALFLLGRALFTPGIGLLAALFLAVCPWHLHFSRIAFELVSFPFLFVLGCTWLVRWTQGRRTLAPALATFGLCLYAYAIAAVFVPLFLLGFSLLYLPALLRRRRETLVALLLLAAVAAPAVYFYNRNQQAGAAYFSRQTFLGGRRDLGDQAQLFWHNYRAFYSPSFLFTAGDPIPRHAVRDHGELYPFYLPFLLLGVVTVLIQPSRASKLLLWWLAVFPTGAALMTEIPSATRSFIGVPAFCLLTAVGFAGALWGVGRIGDGRRWLKLSLQGVALGAAGLVLVPEVARYLHEYFVEYPLYSAPSPAGFQYGDGEAIRYMEGERGNYDLLMRTTTGSNQPYIFLLFYRQLDPREWVRNHDPGYLTLDPAEYSRYAMGQRILYALTEDDLRYFTDFTAKRRIVAPGGQVVLVVAEVRGRKRFLTDWMGLGVFAPQGGSVPTPEVIDARHLSKDRVRGKFGDVYWTPIPQRFTRVDLRAAYAVGEADQAPGSEAVCAYATTTLQSATRRSAFLELAGSGDGVMVWLNGDPLTARTAVLGEQPTRLPLALDRGDNPLLVKTCRTAGNWFFTARIADEHGNDVDTVTSRPDFPLPPVPAPRSRRAASQMVEGFGGIVRFAHTQASYPDYRGGTQSWWIYLRDLDADLAWTTAPVPKAGGAVAAFTASMGEDPGEADLWVNGRYALSFETGLTLRHRRWRRGGFELAFVPKRVVAGNSGVFLLQVPADALHAGAPLDLRVRLMKGHDNAWFMIKAYRDTIAAEGLTSAESAAILAGQPPGLPQVEAAEAAPLIPPGSPPSQIVEGFGTIRRFVHTQGTYPDFRGGSQSWWLYVRDAGADLAWATAPVPSRAATAVAFTASLGEDAGEAELWVNDTYALSFETGLPLERRVWRRGGFALAFSAKKAIAGNSGVFVLEVPRALVEPGKPLELRVRMRTGHDNAWFMIKAYGDTVAHEGLTPARAAALLRPPRGQSPPHS